MASGITKAEKGGGSTLFGWCDFGWLVAGVNLMALR